MEKVIYVKANCIPETVKYLTVDKIYKAFNGRDKDLYEIRNDNNIINLIRINQCAHLDGESWEIVNNEENKKNG